VVGQCSRDRSLHLRRFDGGISVQIQRAVDNGATFDEISVPLGTAIALNAGAALSYAARVMKSHPRLPASGSRRDRTRRCCDRRCVSELPNARSGISSIRRRRTIPCYAIGLGN
ncbi:MAG: hypothetical protein ACREUE_15380, partial [Panacagrimonas sp.]